MSVVARRIASVPRRTSVETWERLVELLTAPGSDARAELQSITSVASMLIAEEYMRGAPATVSGGGPLVRVYTVHSDDAIDHDLDDEADLSFDPTAEDSWLLSLPAQGDDIEVARAAVSGATHVEVRDAASTDRGSEAVKATSTGLLVLDLAELERP
jgi:hypothetical protein